MQPKTPLLYNWEAIKLFLPYLKLSDMLGSATVSKEWQYNLNKYLKQYFLPEPYSEQAVNAFQTVKLVYNRRLVYREGQTVKQIEFPEICSKVEIGTHAIKLETLEGNIYLVKNDRLSTMTKKDWKDAGIAHKLHSNYESARCIGNYLYLVSGSDIIRYTTTPDELFTQKLVLEFQGPIEHILTSLSAVLVVLKTSTKGTQYAYFTHKTPVPRKIQIPVLIDNQETDIMLDFGTHGFIISHQGTLYEADFQSEVAELTEVKMLKGKTISKLKFGYKHYFAYERKKKPINKWTNEEVLKWAEEQGFNDYLKILRAEKVTGNKLLSMDKTYMEDALGMTNILTQQKIGFLIQENNKVTDKFEDYNIYCWGKNDKGQLCANPSPVVNNAVKVKLPEDTELFGCFGDQTLLFNHKTNELTMNLVDEQGKLKWEHITFNKVWTVAGNKNILFFCQSAGKRRIPRNMTQDFEQKKQKLRTAKNIIDKIQWDTNLNKDEFRVGYINRHEGTLECGFDQFMNSEVKEINIIYFKQKGKLIWDKKTRLDIL